MILSDVANDLEALTNHIRQRGGREKRSADVESETADGDDVTGNADGDTLQIQYKIEGEILFFVLNIFNQIWMHT